MFTHVKESRILSSNEINQGRQLELDVAKAVSLIGMVYSHTFENSGFDYSTSFWTSLISNYFAGFLGAPLFMMLMGFGIFYSNNKTPKKLFNKGLTLLFIGYILNIFKYFIPNLISGYTTNLLMPLLNLDILQFAGLGLILFSLLLKIKCSDCLLLIIGMLMNVVGTVFNNISMENTYLSKILGLFIGTARDSHFPLINWFCFIPIGYLFGKLYIHIKDKSRFYKTVGIPSLILGLALTICENILDMGFVGTNKDSYFFITFTDVIISVISLIGFFAIYYLFSNIFHKKVLKVLGNISRNMIYFYVVHIILIRFIVYLLLEVILHVAFTPLLMYFLGTIFTVLTYYISKFAKRKIETA